MSTINYSDAQNTLKFVLDQAADDGVVVSLETFNSYMETFYLLESPSNAVHLEKSIAQYKSGNIRIRNVIEG